MLVRMIPYHTNDRLSPQRMLHVLHYCQLQGLYMMIGVAPAQPMLMPDQVFGNGDASIRLCYCLPSS